MKNLSSSAASAKVVNPVVLTAKEKVEETKKAPAVLIFKPEEKEKSIEPTPKKEPQGVVETVQGVVETVQGVVETTQQEPKQVAPVQLSMEELSEKVDRLHLLRLKHLEIKEKRKQLESFAISHDNNNAQLTLVDANGLSISTSNPQSIGKLIIDWTAELNSVLGKVEEDIRATIAGC